MDKIMGSNSGIRAQFGNLNGGAVYIGDGFSFSSERTLRLNPLRPDSVRWNFLEHLSESSNFTLLAEALIPPTGAADSPFFSNNARLLFEALAISAKKQNQEISIPGIFDMLSRDFQSTVEHIEAADGTSGKASTFLDLAREGSQNAKTILQELHHNLAYWATEEIRLVTGTTNFKWTEILSGKSSLEIAIGEEDESPSPFAQSAAVCSFLTLERLAVASPNGKLPVSVDVVIDRPGCPREITPDWDGYLRKLSARNITVIMVGMPQIGKVAVYREGGERMESEILNYV